MRGDVRGSGVEAMLGDGLRFIVAARPEDDRVVRVEHARPVERGGGVPREEASCWYDVHHLFGVTVQNRDLVAKKSVTACGKLFIGISALCRD